MRGVSVASSYTFIFPPICLFSVPVRSREKKDTMIVCRPTRKAAKTVIRSISCSLQLRLKSNESKKTGDKTLKWTFGYYNFFTPSERDFHSRKCSFLSSFDLSGLSQSTPQHDKQITVIRLNSSGTFCTHTNFTSASCVYRQNFKCKT